MTAPETSLPPVQEQNGGVGISKEVGKLSYAQITQSDSAPTLAVNTIDGKEVVEVPDSVIQHSVPLWDDLIEGRFLSTAPHVAKIHAIVNKIWPLGDKAIRIDVFVVDTLTVKFRIKDTNTRSRILRRGMWNIANIPMVVSKWAPEEEEEEEEEIKIIPMWITLKNVPRQMFSWKGLEFIASAVGRAKRLHPDTLLCKSFDEAKVFVEADMTKELPTSYLFKSKLGVDADVQFEYPWFPTKCKLCSKWGHEEVACGKKKKKGKPLQREKSNIQDTAQDANKIVVGDTTDVIAKETQAVAPSQVNNTETSVAADTHEEESNPVALERKDDEVDTTLGSTEEDKDSERVLRDSEESNWMDVSPSKMGRSATKSVETQNVGSPSRFAILNIDEPEEIEEDNSPSPTKNDDPGTEIVHNSEKEDGESEEGEIVELSSTFADTLNQEEAQATEDQSIRRTSSRATKGINRNSAESFAQSIKETLPRAAGKRRHTKKQ